MSLTRDQVKDAVREVLEPKVGTDEAYELACQVADKLDLEDPKFPEPPKDVELCVRVDETGIQYADDETTGTGYYGGSAYWKCGDQKGTFSAHGSDRELWGWQATFAQLVCGLLKQRVTDESIANVSAEMINRSDMYIVYTRKDEHRRIYVADVHEEEEVEVEPEQMVLMTVCDWNLQNRHYEVPMPLLHEFKRRILSEQKIERVWGWFVTEVDFDGECPEKFCRYVQDKADHTLIEFFFDYNDPQESIKHWELEDEDEDN